ncbi:MAG: hypothetical protein ABI323_01485 [Solirubrobacteraceae bacterium]
MFDRPLEDARALVGREAQMTELAARLKPGTDFLVEGPHRHGKTSLLNAALVAFTNRERGVAVRVDCAGVLTAADFVRRMEDAYERAWAEGSVEELLVERLESLPFRLTGAEAMKPAARLEGLLDVATEVAELTGQHGVVAFDEIQDVLAVPGIVDALGNARNRGTNRIGYVFAGRDLSTAQHGLWSKRAPTVTVGPIESVLFAGEIMRRFAATGRDAGEAAKVIATLGAGHPQRTSLLASQLWELTADGNRATVATARMAIEQSLARCGPEFDVRWNALHGNERRVAVAIANDIAPQGTRAQRATGLASFGAAQRALQGIKSSGVAQTRDERTTLTDPLFAEWLRRRYSQTPAEPDWQTLRRRAELQRGGITRGM